MGIVIVLVLLIPVFVGILVVFFQPHNTISNFAILIHDVQEKPHNLSTISCSSLEKNAKIISKSDFNFIQFKDIDTTQKDQYSIIFDDGFKSNIAAAEILKKHNVPATFFLTTAHLINEETVNIYKNREYLSKEEIQNLSNNGFEIGSHTVHHFDLTLLSKEDLIFELEESKEILERIINKEVTSLSIPYGLWDNNVIEVAQSLGYKNIAIYNYITQYTQQNNLIPSIPLTPLEINETIINKIEETSRFQMAVQSVIPHFAKGSPLGIFHNKYIRLPYPWFSNSKKHK